ncbi:glutamine amidotransferase [Luteolibacter marinus]|uniref:glutamine amidotransferase n=1 Tax=Luteolibacter marinus TaxID=2776705 RepID=UPI001868F831|nr:glutamine amidotransferase [Luteolibacter marinus]
MIGSLATIVFEGGSWAWAGAGLAVLGAAWAAIAAMSQGRQGRRAWWPLGLRITALALLALCLAEPSWVGEEAVPGANLVAVIADNSKGLQVSDAGGGEPRSGQLRSILVDDSGAEAGWLGEVESTFALRRFAMDRGLRRVERFSDLDFEGKASEIGESLEGIRRRFAGRPVAAVILLTDGIATDGIDPEQLAGLPPVYPVLVGDGAPERDLAVTSAVVSESSFEDAPLTFRADVSARGYRGKEVTVRLRDTAGEEVESLRFTPDSATDQRAVRFQHRPAGHGVLFYRIEVSGDGGDEATEANNGRLLTVNRGSGPYRILYVSGRPNWEYKFLNRALAADPEVQLVGLIRVARREPKFQWRAGRGETANPLFRGFNPDDDSAEYDQPVMVRLNTRDDNELAAGFPRTAEELFEYRAVIIDDLEREFFTLDQLELLESFVARRGGSVLMLGGVESFANGDYGNTPMERMLPVHLGGGEGSPPGDDLTLELTRDGWLSPWMRLHDSEAAERGRMAAMGGFHSLNRVAGIKPGATVLAQVRDGGTTRPALAVQRFGDGRVASMMIGDFWRWGFRDPEQRPDMEKAWRQLTRWLLADVPDRSSLALEAGGDGAVKARLRVLDPSFQPMSDARVTVAVNRNGADAVELNATPSDSEAGVFEVTFLPEDGAGTTVTADVRDSAGLRVGSPEDGWVANDDADEFRRLEPDREVLEAIAATTGGRMLEASALDGFARDLPSMEMPETRTWSRSLWHTPLVFLLVLACFAGEWILRRRRGLS